MIVFGLTAFDNAVTIFQTFPELFASQNTFRRPDELFRALLIPITSYNEERLQGLRDAIERLRKKSRSFYLASAAFPGVLRIDMVLL